MRTDGKLCGIDDCGLALFAKGWCQKHYYRNKRHGDPLVETVIRGDDKRRFWSYVTVGTVPRGSEHLGPCQQWNGTLSAGKNGGYGTITMGGKKGKVKKAYRVAYEWAKGPIPDGMTIDHLCHNKDGECPGGRACQHRRCVNPDHLEAVPSAVNTSRRRGRPDRCPNGHLWTEAGYARAYPNGSPKCSTCYPLVHPTLDREKECVNGHAVTPENTFIDSRGVRLCHTCRRESQMRYEAKSKTKIAAYHSQRQQAAKAERHALVARMLEDGASIEDIAVFLNTSIKGAKRTVTLMRNAVPDWPILGVSTR